MERRGRLVRTYKMESTNQYDFKSVVVACPNMKFTNSLGEKKVKSTLFIGSAHGCVSRQFAAQIIRHFRKQPTKTNQ